MERVIRFWAEYRYMFILNVVVVLVLTGMGMVGPTLPLLGKSFGVSTAMVGFLITSFGLARMILNIPAGFLAEKYGRRPILILGPALLTVGSLSCALVGNYWMLVLSRFLQGSGSALYTTAAMTAAVDLSKPTHRARMMAMYQGAIFIGNGLGPALGGFLADKFESFRAPFFVFTVLSLLATIWVWFALPETKGIQHIVSKGTLELDGPSGSKSALRSLLSNSDFVMAGLVTFGVFFTRAGAQFYLIPLVGSERLGLTPGQIGFSLTLAVIANLTVLAPSGWLADRFGRKIVITPANVVSGLSLLMFAFCSDFKAFSMAVIFYGIASGLGGNTPAAYAADVTPPNCYGYAMGLLRTFGDTGFVIAPLLLGWLADSRGYSVALWSNAMIMVAIALLFGCLARETFRRQDVRVGADKR